MSLLKTGRNGCPNETQFRNPKSEIRKKPETRKPKIGPPPRGAYGHRIRISNLGFLSDFGFRISDFVFHSSLQLWRSFAAKNGSPQLSRHHHAFPRRAGPGRREL